MPAVLLLWQAVLGIYLRTIVALAYLLPISVIANQVLFRPKITSYLVPLLIAGLAAGAMTAVRFLPAILTRGTYEAVFPDVSVFGIATIGTFLYPFANPKVPDFEVMRSFFLPAVFLPLLVFVPWRSKLVRAVAIVTGAAVVLGMPFWPWHDAVTNILPGMELNRFRMSDFNVIMLFGIVVLAVIALHRLVVARREVTTETAAGTVAPATSAQSVVDPLGSADRASAAQPRVRRDRSSLKLGSGGLDPAVGDSGGSIRHRVSAVAAARS